MSRRRNSSKNASMPNRRPKPVGAPASAHDDPDSTVTNSRAIVEQCIAYIDLIHEELIEPIQQRLDDHPGAVSSVRWKHILLGHLIAVASGDRPVLTKVRAHLWAMDDDLADLIGLGWPSYRQLICQYHRGIKMAQELFPLDPALNTPAANGGEPKRGFLEAYIVRLLARTRTAGYEPTTVQAIDGTYVNSWGRSAETDPDAAWAHAPGNWSAEHYFGYEAHLMVDTRMQSAASMGPRLITSAVIVAGSAHRGQASLPMIALAKQDLGVSEVIVDRGYSQLGHLAWGQPLAKIGVMQHIDLKSTQRALGYYNGALLIDGGVFSPSLPERLRQLPNYSRDMTYGEREALLDLYDERARYAFKFHGFDRKGNPRFVAPCLVGSVRCTQRRSSLSGELDTPYVHGPVSVSVTPRTTDVSHDDSSAATPLELPRSCTGATFSVPLEQFDGTFQKYPFGTRRWMQQYGQRSQVESINAALQQGECRIAERDLVRVRTGHARAFGIAMVAIVHNLKVIRHWDEYYAAHGTTRAAEAAKEEARRRKRALNE